ncbi:secreted protein, partial [Candidatus Magnetomorum sp. HK-1]
DFLEKIHSYSKQQKNKKIIPSFWSASGFTVQAKNLCKEKNIGIAERIEYL